MTLEEPQGQGMRAEGVRLDYCVFERGDFTASRFERGAIGNGMFNGSTLIRTQFLQGSWTPASSTAAWSRGRWRWIWR